MTNQMSFMNAWDKEEMDGDILDQGNATPQASNSLQQCRRMKQKKFTWLFQGRKFCIRSCDQENFLMLFIRKMVITAFKAWPRPTQPMPTTTFYEIILNGYFVPMHTIT